MKLNLQPVPYEDFDLEALRLACKEGRLFMQPKKESIEKVWKDNAKQVLTYIHPLHPYASECFRPYLQQLWKEIVYHPQLIQHFTIRQGKNEGKINKYFITYLVEFLRNWHVYDCRYSVQLHLVLENTQKRNKYYTGKQNYDLSDSEKMIIKGFLMKYYKK